mgnify:CR=1 FL=1|tara:strand:- start:250 stop:450 length:201 start_codon:yes stop_codon:yes gene_type:complete
MNKLTNDEARFLRRWLSIEEDTERELFLRAFKMKEDYRWFWIGILCVLLVMIGNYFGLEEWGEWYR